MKKIIIITIVTLATAGLFYVMRNDSSGDKTGTPVATESDNFHPDPSNATFTFDDGPITLSAGRNERSIAPGSALLEETTLMDAFAYSDVNADGKGDTLLLLARYGGGSGTFIYLAGFVSGPVTYRGSEAVFIGDRIAPQSISVNGEIITVQYLDRGPDEAFSAEPTVPTTKQFVYKSGTLQEK